MKRRTLDIVFSTGGAVLAVALVVLGVVFVRDASFAKTYVADQLGQQKITFTPVEGLSEEEKQASCLVEHAGQPLTTGKQAECYANEYIGLHLRTNPVANGRTYAELGGVQRDLRAQIAAAQESNDPSVGALQLQLADITDARETMFKGETLRGLLLTSYGFSVFGEKAGQAATGLFTIAGILALLAVAGFVHAFTTPADERVNLNDLVGNAKEAQRPTRSGSSGRRRASPRKR